MTSSHTRQMTITESMKVFGTTKAPWPVIDLAQKDSEVAPTEPPGPPPPTKRDLLTHKYRPDTVDSYTCHLSQARRLREWVQEFTLASRNRSHDVRRHLDYDDSSSLSDASDTPEVARKCVLLTGPPGVGKTSLVYTVARELKMHVIESHSSEKRDFRLFSTLKLANQKGKINPVAKLFQVCAKQHHQLQQKQACNGNPVSQEKKERHAKRKRRKLESESAKRDDQLPTSNRKTNGSNSNNNQQLSLSGDSSIVLFDDIDVVFEEDGPFLKSLIEFIGESKRPVILTATQSIHYLKEKLVHFEHIHLGKPLLEDFVKLLQEICTQENYPKLATVMNCRILAKKTNCDLRQCLNRIQFYGEQASSELQDDTSCEISNVVPDLCRLSYSHLTTTTNSTEASETNGHQSNTKTALNDDDETIFYDSAIGCYSSPLDCYNASSVVDLMDSALNLVDRPTLLGRWLDGIPSSRNEEPTSEHELGEQIRNSIIELTRKSFESDLVSRGESQRHEREFELTRDRAQEMSQRINLRIDGRIEPPDRDFYIDIVAMLGEIIKLETERKRQCASNKGGGRCTTPTINGRPRSPVTGSGTILSRRTRRVQSYLDLAGVYFEPEELVLVEQTLLTPLSLGPELGNENDNLLDGGDKPEIDHVSQAHS